MSNLDTILKNKYGFENPFKPDPLVEKALPYLTKGKNLLDVGCGEGALQREGSKLQLWIITKNI
jgi:2-polyprenyl-3-methyl-5-hydroxy-6-metoxy-1,4-benzoquinol methylase